MIDYNDIITVEEKIEYMQDKIEEEKGRFYKLLKGNKDQTVRLKMLEQYYLLLLDLNGRNYSENEKQ